MIYVDELEYIEVHLQEININNATWVHLRRNHVWIGRIIQYNFGKIENNLEVEANLRLIRLVSKRHNQLFGCI